MTILLWVAGTTVALGILAYLGLWAAFFVVNRLPDVEDFMTRRPGRKRKCRVSREPNGGVQRRPAAERAEAIVAVARAAPHRQVVLGINANGKLRLPDPRDPRLGSEFGRLRIRDLITPEQYAAGLRWGRIVIRMCRALDVPPGSPRNVLAALEGSAGAGTEMSPEDAAEARAAYDDAHRALTRNLGLGDRRVLPNLLRQVILEDRPCADLVRLRGALTILARHFDTGGKRVSIEAPAPS